MANTVVVKCVVEELSKYGFKMNGQYINYSKQLSEAEKAHVVPGASFEAEMYVADSGKQYLNKIIAVIPTQPNTASAVKTPAAVTDINPPVDVERAKKAVDSDRAKHFTPKFEKKAAPDNSMSKDEWAAKDKRISRQGCIQAAVHALGPVMSNVDDLFATASLLADKMLEYVNKA